MHLMREELALSSHYQEEDDEEEEGDDDDDVDEEYDGKKKKRKKRRRNSNHLLFYCRLYQQFMDYIMQVLVLGFNSAKYDLNMLKPLDEGAEGEAVGFGVESDHQGYLLSDNCHPETENVGYHT